MRRKKAEKRDYEPDRQYDSVIVTRFINHVMKKGKKSIAKRIVYRVLSEAEKQSKKPALEVLDAAMKNIAPVLEVKSRRIGGASYQVPREVRGERRTTLAFRWLIDAARSKKGAPMSKRLTEELLLASKNEGAAVKKKENVHRMAEANRAFAHFSW